MKARMMKGKNRLSKYFGSYGTNNLVAINLANKQNVQYLALRSVEIADGDTEDYQNYDMPSIASVVVQLMTPKGDKAGWKSGVRLLYQQLRTANTGRINYRAQDLERYVQNVRTLHAMSAWLTRLYKITYTFRSTNDLVPYGLLLALGVDPTDIMQNAADIYQYAQRFAQECKANFPLAIPYYSYTEELFDKVWTDSKTTKPSFYVTTFTRGYRETSGNVNGLLYYINTNSEPLNRTWEVRVAWDDHDNLYKWADIQAQYEEVKDQILQNNVTTIIAGEIIRAYKDKAFSCGFKSPNVDQEVEFLYDEEVLTRLQNANVLSVRRYAFDNYAAEVNRDNAVYSEGIGSDGWLDGRLRLDLANVYGGGTWTVESGLAKNYMDRINQYMLNWHDDSISAEQIMMISRWVPTNVTVASSTTTPNDLDFAVFGTECITSVESIQFVSANELPMPDYADAQYLPIAGIVIHGESSSGINNGPTETGNNFMIWANFDMCPRLLAGTGAMTATSPAVRNFEGLSADVLDWDIFAVMDSNNAAIYYSYGNQSLLNAGKSQSTSHTDVYAKDGKGGNARYGKDKSNNAKSERTAGGRRDAGNNPNPDNA